MFTKQSLPATVNLKMELSHGDAMAREIYRKQMTFVDYFRALVFGKANRKPQDVLAALGDQGKTWVKSVEAACDFVGSANEIDNTGKGRPSWMPQGWSYSIDDVGGVQLIDNRIGALAVDLAAQAEGAAKKLDVAA